jgi:hypothetical protein
MIMPSGTWAGRFEEANLGPAAAAASTRRPLGPALQPTADLQTDDIH